MPRNGSGTFTVYTPGNPVVTGAVISSTAFNATMTDFATGLTNSIAKDGQTTPTANLPMGTYKHTGVAVGSALTDYARYDQVQNSAPQWLTSVSGTDTITASATVAPSAYAAGQTFRFVPAGANTTAAVTLNVNSLGAKNVYWGASALPAGAIGASTVVEVTYDGTQFQVTGMQAVGTSAGNLVRLDSSGKLPAVDGSQLTGIGGSAKVNNFRLTLTSATPVTTSDVTGAGTIYACPYDGNQISLYTGGAWVTRSSAQFSLALSALTSGKPYDVFCYDNSGTPTLEALVWTNDTTRATALTYQDGVLVKSGDATRRYLGTFYTTSTTTTEDSANNRYLWNYYNRVARSMLRRESTASWTYTTATTRQANGSTSNQLNFVRGLDEDAMQVQLTANSQNGSTCNVVSGMGLDSTSSMNIGNTAVVLINSSANSVSGISQYHGLPGLGRHYIAWLETSQAAGTTTWYGSTQSVNGGSGLQGLQGSMLG